MCLYCWVTEFGYYLDPVAAAESGFDVEMCHVVAYRDVFVPMTDEVDSGDLNLMARSFDYMRRVRIGRIAKVGNFADRVVLAMSVFYPVGLVVVVTRSGVIILVQVGASWHLVSYWRPVVTVGDGLAVTLHC